MNRNLLLVLSLACLIPLLGCAATKSPKHSLAIKNLNESNAWLAENRKLADVFETNSGLQYKILKTSDSTCKPDPSEPVVLHYETILTKNNKLLDSSYQRNQPGRYKLNEMIPAWEEGIPMMREGEIWMFYVPPSLAYGEKGSPPSIGPNVMMSFKVELLQAGRCVPCYLGAC